MHYQEFQPNSRLADYVQLIWVMESESPNECFPKERILPDGIVELVIHYGQPLTTHRADGSSRRQPAAFAISQMREFIEIESTGAVGFISIRFFPWGAWHFFQTPIRSFLDETVGVDILWPAHFSRLESSIRESRDHESRKRIVEDFLGARLTENQRSDSRTDQAIRQIRHSAGQLSIADVCLQNGLSEKQLQRNFLASVGTTPKIFSRVSRFLHICKHMAEYRNTSLTELAQMCGFFDQSHFIKEFRQFSGFTPGQFFDRDDVGYADI